MPDRLTGAAIVAQSGGPTAVINCSLAGVIQESLKHDQITRILGARNGIMGVLEDQLYDLGQEDPADIEGLKATPAAALGTCRYKLKEDDYQTILDLFEKHNIRYFFYAGGNDSQDTCHKVAQLAQRESYDLRCIGIPKTVDNDLAHTDHCPGYGSVARAIAIMTMDAGRDNEAIYTADTVKVVETMGRNTGWIAAAAGFPHQTEEDAPHLVYVPERPFAWDRFLADVQSVLDRLGRCTVAVSEGLVDESGEYITARTAETSAFFADDFGHVQLGGVGDAVCKAIEHNLNVKARFNKPGTGQRACAVMQSRSDAEEAYLVGQMAVRYALQGEHDKMVSLVRESNDPYTCLTGLVPCEEVALAEKPLPDEYINDQGNHITEAFKDYLRPLLGDPLPHYVRLQRIPA
ncbi:MAG: 6-phosphofructokinase [Armatimonadota bacterium]